MIRLILESLSYDLTLAKEHEYILPSLAKLRKKRQSIISKNEFSRHMSTFEPSELPILSKSPLPKGSNSAFKLKS
jgi:hypothetical protein